MAYDPQDHYFKKAKKEGFLARSAYKLDEIQLKYRIIRQNDKVLDLGCAPGAWSQIILKILGTTGSLRGIDLKAVQLKAKNAIFVEKDIFATEIAEFLEAPYNNIVSDMAPSTSGIPFRDQALSEELCLKVIELSDVLLKPSGNLVMKLFMGSGAKHIELEVKRRFEKHHLFRPLSTRKESKEIFLIGLRKRQVKLPAK
ncbi:MAG: RlmE family RNA methyltransferase [Bdellovibrionales bacterium]